MSNALAPFAASGIGALAGKPVEVFEGDTRVAARGAAPGKLNGAPGPKFATFRTRAITCKAGSRVMNEERRAKIEAVAGRFIQEVMTTGLTVVVMGLLPSNQRVPEPDDEARKPRAKGAIGTQAIASRITRP
ncbi:hypothetical protein [Paraburkholderia heleia]|uniref:hypothetical protein n=1 Tax=Paraburkholderia heleia TaxID=634127 RepID=UPI0005A69B96|nr:hypothetical protein [Paraburkholderia heleia]